MKRLTLLLALTISCSEEETPLTPNLVTEVKAFDLGNNGDGSDIRVDFIVQNNLNVEEYRIMILLASDSSSFGLGEAQSIPASNYLSIIAESFETIYSVNRLTSNLLDANGSLIQDEGTYVTVILVKGVAGFQLSGFSMPYTLKEQGVYSGRYRISATAFCRFLGGNTGPWNAAPNTSQVEIKDTEGEYSGRVDCTLSSCSSPKGSFFLIIDGSDIVEFRWEWPSYVCPEPNCGLSFGCARLGQGQGIVEDELIFQISVQDVSCFANCESIYTLIRQS